MSSGNPKIERHGDVTILTFASHVRGAGNPITAQLAGRAAALGRGHLLLDFTNVDRINSEELGTLIDLNRTLNAAGGRLTLFNLSAAVYEVFRVTHLHTLLPICREQGEGAPDRPSPEGRTT